MKSINKYICCFKLSIGQSFEYRSDFLLNFIATFIPIGVQLFLWTAIYENSEEVIINGRTYIEMITYLCLSFFVTFFLSCTVANTVAADIKEGNLNQYIIRPVNYILYRLVSYYGSKAFLSVTTAVLLVVTFLVFKLKWQYSIPAANILLFILLIFISLFLQFLMFLCMGLSTFWITDSWGIFFGGRYIINILSGSLLPLDLFGDKILFVLKFLPFQYTTFFPISVIQSKVSAIETVQGIVTEIFWIMILLCIARGMWQKGQLKYIANGG